LIHFAESLKLFISFHRLNLVQNVLEHSVRRQIVELSQSSVDTLSVVESNSGRPISFVDTLGLTQEHDLIQLGWVDINMLNSVMVQLIVDVVVE
jgi:hypothetical protein